METITPEELLEKYLARAEEHIHSAGQLQRDLLELRLGGLKGLGSLIAAQTAAFDGGQLPVQPALFDRDRLEEFALGSVAKALGTEFEIYAGRRSPRIPNGDLLLMSRVLTIDGRRGDFTTPADVTVEYDAPADAWFFGPGSDGSLPFSVLLEIALQPCGVLTAYLGTQLRLPEIDFFFRNLDGTATLLRGLDARGKTIHTRARLLETVFSGTTIIQHFSFELSIDGLPFFRGRSSFGYFPEEQMAAQAGLDGGKAAPAWYQAAGKAQGQLESCPAVPRPSKLNFIERVLIEPEGGRRGAGYVYGLRRNDPSDWYYACHFYQDPVMPGSLGLEAIMQAAQVFAARRLGSNTRVRLAVGREVAWKYRGQVLPGNREMRLEAHIHPQEADVPNLLIADASLWADELRIYEVKGLAVEVYK